MQRLPGLFIAPSDRGTRGVFTSMDIPAESLIEICPVIAMDLSEQPLLDQTRLYDYYFIWGENDQQCAIALGYGSLYNHDYNPNAEYRPDYSTDELCFYALREIVAGSEITVNYSGDPSGARKMWFEVK